MPAKSRRQQQWAFAVKGEKWAKQHHMDKVAKPAAKKKTVGKKK